MQRLILSQKVQLWLSYRLPFSKHVKSQNFGSFLNTVSFLKCPHSTQSCCTTSRPGRCISSSHGRWFSPIWPWSAPTSACTSFAEFRRDSRSWLAPGCSGTLAPWKMWSKDENDQPALLLVQSLTHCIEVLSEEVRHDNYRLLEDLLLVSKDDARCVILELERGSVHPVSPPCHLSLGSPGHNTHCAHPHDEENGSQHRPFTDSRVQGDCSCSSVCQVAVDQRSAFEVMSIFLSSLLNWMQLTCPSSPRPRNINAVSQLIFWLGTDWLPTDCWLAADWPLTDWI